MKADIIVVCYQCRLTLGKVTVNTAGLPEQLPEKINSLILKHRKACDFYGETDAPAA